MPGRRTHARGRARRWVLPAERVSLSLSLSLSYINYPPFFCAVGLGGCSFPCFVSAKHVAEKKEDQEEGDVGGIFTLAAGLLVRPVRMGASSCHPYGFGL